MISPSINVSQDGGMLRVGFESYGLDAYRFFVRTKQVPEGRVEYDKFAKRYSFSCPSRYAGILGIEAVQTDLGFRPACRRLRDYQAACVRIALECKRFALWADTGLGKTLSFLEWAGQVVHRTNGRVLIFSPLNIIEQTIGEHAEYYPDDAPIVQLRTREEIVAFATGSGPGLAITNFEKLDDGVIAELRQLAGVVIDEASMLKTAGGVRKWNVIKSCIGIPYKLLCTATPAPNDIIEYASQAGFLEKLRSEGEMIWTFFKRNKDGTQTLKPHAEAAFYRFMAGWSIYLRDPSRYGWEDVLKNLPKPVTIVHEIAATPEQIEAAQAEHSARSGDLLGGMRMGVATRTKLSQIAKGFVYGRGGKKRVVSIPSLKPARVCEITAADSAAGHQVIVWTVFDEETSILMGLFAQAGLAAESLTGATKEKDRSRILHDFRAGTIRVLVTRADMVGKGMNFQFCTSMVFSGFNDSFESIYQAERRCYRPGQTRTVRVHVPLIPELEGAMFENIEDKRRSFERDCSLCEDLYLAAFKGLGHVA